MGNPPKKSFWENLKNDAISAGQETLQSIPHLPAQVAANTYGFLTGQNEGPGDLVKSVLQKYINFKEPTKQQMDEAVAEEREDERALSSGRLPKQRPFNGNTGLPISTNFANEAYTHPVHTALDASMLFGGAGDAAEAVNAGRLATGLRTASAVLNPATVPLRLAAKAVSPITRKIVNTAAARAQAVADSKISPKILIHPNVQENLENVVAQKGASVPAVREAVLRAAGAEPENITRGATTRAQPPAVRNQTGVIKDQAKAADTAARDAINQQTASMSPDVDPTDIGRDFIDNYRAAKENVKSGYRQAFANDGVFHPDSLENLPQYIGDSLTSGEKIGGPSSIMAFKKAPNTYEQTNQALFGRPATFDAQGNLIEEARPSIFSGLQDMAHENGGLSLGDIEMHRRELDSLIGKASNNTDISALTSIKDGLENWVSETAPDATKFTGNGEDLAVDMANARRGYHEYRKTYFDSGANPSVVRARASVDPRGLLDPAEIDPAGMAVPTVTDHLTKDILDPKSKTVSPKTASSGGWNGQHTYEDLTGGPTPLGYSALTPDGINALNEHIRSKFFMPNMGSDDLEASLNSPFAKTLKPGENGEPGDIDNLRLQSAAHDILDQPRPNKSDIGSGQTSVLKQLGVGALSEGAAMVGEHGLNAVIPGSGTVAKFVAGPVGGWLEHRRESRNATDSLQQELSGAPAITTAPNFQSGATALNLVPRAGDQRGEAESSAPGKSQKTVDIRDIDKEPDPMASASSAPSSAPTGKVVNIGDIDSVHDPLADQPQPHAAGGRAARASGGRAHINPHTVERLTNKLMKRLNRAKKESSKMTEPLLNQDDSVIARALAVASKDI